MKKLSVCLLTAVLSCWCATAFGWGKIGHDAIAYIAECNLTPRAKKNIARYLEHSIVYYASWMDKYRDTPEFRNVEHVSYVDADMQLGDTLRKGKTNCGVELMRAVERLKDYRNMSDSLVRLNLMYVIHIVGDMHCPGHVRWPDNQEIGYFNVVLKGSEIRYHTIWDTPIVATTHPWSFSDLAFLLDRYTEEQQRAAIAGDIYDWGRESAANSKCIYDVKPGDKLGHDFILKYKPLAEEQLAKAGYRLAKVLNDIFDRQ